MDGGDVLTVARIVLPMIEPLIGVLYEATSINRMCLIFMSHLIDIEVVKVSIFVLKLRPLSFSMCKEFSDLAVLRLIKNLH